MVPIVAIDPGVHELFAAFRGSCGGLHVAKWTLDQFRATCRAGVLRGYTLAIERPVIRSAARSKGDPEDIARLREVVGRTIEAATWGDVANVAVFEPSEWKGSAPKVMHNRRVLGAMRAVGFCGPALSQVAAIAKTYRHNYIDAAGIYLFAAGYTAKSGDAVSINGPVLRIRTGAL